MRRARAGDRAATAELVERVTLVVSARARWFIRRYGVRWDVREMVDDVWVCLLADDWRRLMKWRGNGGKSLPGFVADPIATQLWLNDLRGTRPEPGEPAEPAEPGAGPEPTPERLAVSRDLLARLWSFLVESLPPFGLSVLRLRFTDGLASAEVAAALGVSVQVVDNWIFKIRTLARQFLRDHGGYDD